MALPILALIQAATTLIPLFSKKGPSEKAAAKKLLKANNGPVSSSVGIAAITASLGLCTQVSSLEEAIMPLILALFGLYSYFKPAKS